MGIILTVIWECCAYIFFQAGLEVFFYGIGRLCLSPFTHDEPKKSSSSQKTNHLQEGEKHEEYSLSLTDLGFQPIVKG